VDNEDCSDHSDSSGSSPDDANWGGGVNWDAHYQWPGPENTGEVFEDAPTSSDDDEDDVQEFHPTAAPPAPSATTAGPSAPAHQVIDVLRLIGNELRPASDVKITYLPTGGNFRGWRAHSRQAIITASGKPAEGQAWIDEVDLKTMSALHNDGHFQRLSSQLTSCLLKLYREKGKGPLADQIRRLEEQYIIMRRILPGRVVYKTIIDYFKADRHDLADQDIGNLQAVQYNGNLIAFINQWDRVILHSATDVGYKLKAFHFHLEYSKITGYADITNDQSRYRRRQRAGKFKSDQARYEFLYKSVRDTIDSNRKDQAVLDSTSDLRRPAAPHNGTTTVVEAAPANPTMKAKDRNKGRKAPGKAEQPKRKVETQPDGCPPGHCWDHFVHESCDRNKAGLCTFKHELTASNANGLPAAKAKAKSKGEPPVSHRTSTQLCGFFAKNRCANGDKCRYTHGTDDPRPLVPKS